MSNIIRLISKKLNFSHFLSYSYPLVLLILSVILVFRKIIFSGKLLYGLDMVIATFYWSEWPFNLIHNGYFPLWNPYVASGISFIADPLAAMFYLPNYIFAILPTYLAMNMSIVLHVMFAGITTYFYMRVISADRLASLFSAVVLMFSGVFLFWSNHYPVICSMSWLPALFLLTEKGIRVEKLSYFLFLGIAISLQILTGYLQYSYYNILIIVAYFTFRTVLISKSQGWLAIRLIKYCLISLIFGLLLSAIQFFPTFYMLKQSPLRAGINIEVATIGIFPLENLVTLITPDFFGNDISYPYWGRLVLSICNVYLGLAPLILVLGLSLLKKNKYTIFFMLAGFIFLLLAIGGEKNPLFMLCYKFLPGFNMWRLPARMLFISTFCLSILAGFSLSQIRHELSQNILKKRCFWALTLSIFIFIIALLGFISYSNSGWSKFVEWVMSGGSHVAEISDLYKVDKIAFIMQAKNIAQLALFKSLILCGLAMLLIFVLLNKKIKESLAKSLIIMLVFFDLSLMNGKSILGYDWKRLHFSSGVKAFFAKEKEPYRIATLLPGDETLKMDNLRSSIYGIQMYSQSYINMGMLDNIANVVGISRIFDKRYSDFVGIRSNPQDFFFTNFIKNPKAVNMLNVKYYMYPKDVEKRGDYIHDQFMERNDLLLRYADDKVSIYENPKVYKRSFMVYSLIKVNDPENILKMIFDSSFDPALQAAVETEDDLSQYRAKVATDSN